MPINPVDYSKTVIYKLYCINPDVKDFYIGHTTNLKQRKGQHKTHCNNNNKPSEHNRKVYQIIRNNGGFDNWKFMILQEAELNNKNEAEELERQWIEKLKPSCNYQLPGEFCTDNIKEYKQSWYEAHKPEILAKAKAHYEEHKEEKMEYQKKYYLENKDKIGEYNKKYQTENSELLKAQKKLYREKNAEMLKQGQKEWREKNKEKLQQQNSIRFECECGMTYISKNKARHYRSKRHEELMAEANLRKNQCIDAIKKDIEIINKI